MEVIIDWEIKLLEVLELQDQMLVGVAQELLAYQETVIQIQQNPLKVVVVDFRNQDIMLEQEITLKQLHQEQGDLSKEM
jgi:hypothetical protein